MALGEGVRGTKRRATIQDVAREARVSIATVSRVLNGTAHVEEETTARVQQAVAELRYRPAAAAQVLARQRTNAIGLRLSRIGGDYFTPLLRGIEAEVAGAGMTLLISTAGPTGGPVLAEHNTDGLLVFADALDDAGIRMLWEHEHPVVLLHRTPPEGLPVPSVTIENKSGARRLVDHLIEVHHCECIAFLRGPAGHEDSAWRELGFRASLEAHGLDADAALVAEGDFDTGTGEAQVARWLAEGRAIDAIFAGDDAAAVGALRAIGMAGASRRMAVVGFDDTPLARYLSPPLTTVSAPIEQVGREAVRLLLALRQGLGVTPLVLLPTQLVIRRSCGCGPSDGHRESR